MDFNYIATGIGSILHFDPDKATALVCGCLPEAPFWTQLPQRSLLEHFCVQCGEALPEMIADRAKEWLSVDPSRVLSCEVIVYLQGWQGPILHNACLSSQVSIVISTSRIYNAACNKLMVERNLASCRLTITA